LWLVFSLRKFQEKRQVSVKSKQLLHDLSILVRFNWHVHTNFSTCANVDMTVPSILASVKDSDLEGVAFVDHHRSRKHDIMSDLTQLKNEIEVCQTKLKVFVGAELSAFGIGKYSDSIETNRMINYRLYACNHYHLSFWEHPATTSPRAYAEHSLAILTCLLKSQRADCIAHPFIVTSYLKGNLYAPTSVTRAISDKELANILELGKNNDVAWELNAKVILEDPQFARRYWNIGREVGVSFHFGTDAHRLSEIDPRQYVGRLESILGEH